MIIHWPGVCWNATPAFLDDNTSNQVDNEHVARGPSGVGGIDNLCCIYMILVNNQNTPTWTSVIIVGVSYITILVILPFIIFLSRDIAMKFTIRKIGKVKRI